MHRTIDPLEVATDPRCLLLDVRTRHERVDGIGFIPGSVWLPLDELAAAAGNSARILVLICQSGRRSGELVDELAAEGHDELNLAAGVLAWCAAGLPLCDVDQTSGPPLSVTRFRREVLSCFVAEAVECLALDEDPEDFDPVSVVEGCFDRFARPWSIDGARRALDDLSDVARQNGHPIEVIARNVSRLYYLAERVQ